MPYLRLTDEEGQKNFRLYIGAHSSLPANWTAGSGEQVLEEVYQGKNSDQSQFPE